MRNKVSKHLKQDEDHKQSVATLNRHKQNDQLTLYDVNAS